MSARANSKGAEKPRLTRFTPFQSLGTDGSHLFAVNAGVSAANALDEAACFLSTATECIRTLAMELAEENGGDYRAWAALYLCEISYAVVVASIKAVREEDRS